MRGSKDLIFILERTMRFNRRLRKFKNNKLLHLVLQGVLIFYLVVIMTPIVNTLVNEGKVLLAWSSSAAVGLTVVIYVCLLWRRFWYVEYLITVASDKGYYFNWSEVINAEFFTDAEIEHILDYCRDSHLDTDTAVKMFIG